MQLTQDKTQVIEAARELGRELRQLPEYKVFYEAQQVFNQDEEVQQLVEDYNATIKKLQLNQQLEIKDEALMRTHRELSDRLETHAVIQTLMTAQKAWKQKLIEANQQLSDRLDIDFAQMAKPQGGCC